LMLLSLSLVLVLVISRTSVASPPFQAEL